EYHQGDPERGWPALGHPNRRGQRAEPRGGVASGNPRCAASAVADVVGQLWRRWLLGTDHHDRAPDLGGWTQLECTRYRRPRPAGPVDLALRRAVDPGARRILGAL